MTRRWSASLLACGLLVATPLTARGDVVYLRNGGTIEGRVVERGGDVDVELPFGTIRLDRDDVVSVWRGPTSGERLESALAKTDTEDPVALEAAAAEAERLGLPERAVELRTRAFDLELERRLADVPTDDADGLVALAVGLARAMGTWQRSATS